MTDLENSAKQELTESRRISECPPDQVAASPMATPTSGGTPVSVNVNMTASGKEHVNDLLAMMKAAGLDNADQMKPDMMPMRQDMERLRGIVDEPEIAGNDDAEGDQDLKAGLPAIAARAVGGAAVNALTSEEDLDEYDNEPDEEYRDHEYMTHDLSGGINRRKKSYSDAEDGDNAMAVHEKEADPAVIAKVQELSKINNIDVLKKEVYDLVKNTKMNKAKKMELMRNTENSRTVKNLIGLLWNTFVLGAEGKHAPGSSWSKRFENIEDEMRENIKSQLLKSLEEKKAKPDYIDIDGDGDTKEPMKKAAKDKKKKVPPQFQKKK